MKKHFTNPRLVFIHMTELLVIILSFLQSSRLARFMAAKVSMDVIVEVTARFGPDAGHRLSTFMAAIVAEPKIAAVVVTAVIIVCHAVIFLACRLTRRYRHVSGRKRLPGSDARREALPQEHPRREALPEERVRPDAMTQGGAPAEKVPEGWPFEDIR